MPLSVEQCNEVTIAAGDTLLPTMLVNYGQRPNSANATATVAGHDKCNNVFFGEPLVAREPFVAREPLVARKPPRSPDHCQQKMSRNISVESAGSSGSRKLRKSRSHTSVRPPDGGWGWVIVFASFIISMIADGISFSFGIFFVDLSNYFGASKVSTPTPLLAGVF